MKLKSRLLSLSLICIQCQSMSFFSFAIFYLQVNAAISKYMLTVFWGILGHSKFHFWDHVLSWLTGKYHWSVQQGRVWDLCFSLIWIPVLLPDTGSLQFGFKWIIIVLQKRRQILFTYKALPTIRHRNQIWGKKKASLFIVQNLQQIMYSFHHHADSALLWLDLQSVLERSGGPWLRWQFVSSLVWHISHHWTVNHVQPFCIQWCRNVAKMHMAHNIYAKFCNDCDPWLYKPVNLGHN